MMPASLSILVPTVGRGRLDQLDASLRWQLHPGDEVLILGDVASGPLPEVEREVAAMGQQYRYLPLSAGHHCYGHCNLNEGIRAARNAWLVFNDDDDVFAAGALEAMRSAIARLAEPAPLLFRFQTHRGFVVWDEQVLRQGHISGQCIVCPNDASRLGAWECRYEGDYDFVASTVARYGAPVWEEAIVAIGRPHLREQGSAGWACPVATAYDVEQLRQARNGCAGTFAHHNDQITPAQQAAWWAAASDSVRAWLYRHPVTGALLGFGLLTWKGDAWWTTVGVLPEARRQGIGRTITTHLIHQVDGPVYGEALRTNPGGVAVHDPAFWEPCYEDARVLRFRVRDRSYAAGESYADSESAAA